MKLALVTVFVCLGNMAHAAQINSAWLNVEKQVIEMELVNSGSCDEIMQPVKLNVDHCSRSNPMTCVAVLETPVNNSCNTTVNQMIEVSATEYMNDDTLKQLVILDSQRNPVVVDFSEIRF